MNPLEMIYEECMLQAKANIILQKKVKDKNFVSFNQRNITKKSISSADLPELALLQLGIQGDLRGSSSRSSLEIMYEWALTSGSQDLKSCNSELQWGLITLFSNLCSSLSSLQWNGRPFVVSVETQTSAMVQYGDEMNRGIYGWTTHWPFNVRTSFDLKTLMSYQNKE